MPTQAQTAALEVAGMHWASEQATVEAVLGRRPGVLAVEANPVGQTAVITYDPATTSIGQLSAWVRDCGYHCAGQSVPRHVCDPQAEPSAHHTAPADAPADGAHAAMHHGTGHAAMGHGGGHDMHAGHDMAGMAADMRNRSGPRRRRRSPPCTPRACGSS